jgi:adenylosuccinate lyase
MVGRSHGIHAEPITFGFKLAGWLAEVPARTRSFNRLRRDIAIGKISGAVGTYANIDPKIEALTCQKLGLEFRIPLHLK